MRDREEGLNCNEKQQCENSPHLIYVKAALSIFRLDILQTMQHSITFLGTFYVSSLHGYMLVLRALPPPPAFFLQQGLSLIGGGLSLAFYRRPTAACCRCLCNHPGTSRADARQCQQRLQCRRGSSPRRDPSFWQRVRPHSYCLRLYM